MDRRLIDSFEGKSKSAFRNFKFAILLGAMLFALCLPVEAQPAKIYRVGYLDSSTSSGAAPLIAAFRQGLRELGWVEGKNIAFEYRFTEGKGPEHRKELAAELVRLKVDVIVARATSSSMVAKEASSTIPIVMVAGGDPVGAGIIKTLAQPGGNITGISSLSHELITKRLEILKDVVPKLSLMAVLSVGERRGVGPERQIKELEPAAQSLQVKLLHLEAKREVKGLKSAFETAVRKRADAITHLSGPPSFALRKPIVELAAKHRLPAIYSAKEFVMWAG